MSYIIKPATEELPPIRTLVKSIMIAIAVSGVLFFVAFLPAERGIDPTGLGRILGLTQMGELKLQMAREAEVDHEPKSVLMPIVKAVQAKPVTESPKPVEPVSQPVSTTKVVEEPVSTTKVVEQSVSTPIRSDEVNIKLTPGQGAEVKLEMLKGAKVTFSWSGNGGRVNYDTHGDPYKAKRGFYHGYGKGRAVPEKNGELVAAFDGHHGWFWRNRTESDVTVTLRVEGDYLSIKRMM